MKSSSSLVSSPLKYFNSFREDQKIYGDSGLTILTYFKYIGPFTICWEATNYMYIRALGSIHVTDATALFTTNTAFVYICSWIWLKEKYILIPARVRTSFD